jgi:nicotinate-nucleotide adenylyltransferase
MLAASITADPRLTIDDCEIRREGVSYTVDTVADVIKRYVPEGKPGLILGDDLGKDFPKWRRASELAELADIIIARRIHSEEAAWSFPCRQIQNEVMEISSAMVREKIAAGKGWRYLVSEGARTIIEDRGLYGLIAAEQPVTQELLIRIENIARESLKAGRFLHSRNTAILSWDLCRRFGLDPRLGYLAGVSHDLGKPLGAEELLALSSRDGGEISDLERKKPDLLHGRAAAVLLRERFGIHNKEVLEAIAWHTEGSLDMGPLAKVIYIADKIEVSRDGVDPALRMMSLSGSAGSAEDLDQLFAKVLDDNISWLRSKKMDISEGALQLQKKIQTGKAL